MNEITDEKVIEDKLILKGDKVDGVDYTHFDFLIRTHEMEFSAMLEDENTSAYDAMKMVWGKIWPYLEAEMEDKEHVYDKLRETAKDADDTVRLGFEMKFKLDHAINLIRKTGMEAAYNKRIRDAKQKLRHEINRQIKEGVIGKENA